MDVRRNTTQTVRVGPFLSVGVSGTAAAVEAFNITTADSAVALKDPRAGGVRDLSAQTFTSASGSPGYKNLELTAGVVDTVGQLIVSIIDDNQYLPVHHTFRVVNEPVFDAMYSQSASGYATASSIQDLSSSLQTQIAGVTTALGTLSGNLATNMTDLSANLGNSFDALSAGNSARIQALSASLNARFDSLSASVAAISGVDPAAISDALWDEAAAGHTGGLAEIYSKVAVTVVSTTFLSQNAVTVASEFDALSAAVGAISSNLSTALDDISDLASRVNDVSANLQTVDDNVDSALSAVQSGTVNINMDQSLPASASAGTVGDALLQVTLEINPPYGQAFANVPVYMVQSSDHVSPATGIAGSLTVEVARDTEAFTAGAGSIHEIGSGKYRYSAGAADMQASLVTFKVTGGSADPFLIAVATSPQRQT